MDEATTAHRLMGSWSPTAEAYLQLLSPLTGDADVESVFNRAVPYIGMTLALLFIMRGMSLGIPYLSPKITHTAAHTTEITCCTKP